MTYSLLRKWGVALLIICGCSQAADAQDSNVRGRIYDENNERLVGAMIVLTELGPHNPEFATTVSTGDGSFYVDSGRDSVLLKAFLIGYKPIEMRVPRNYEVDIHMEPNPVGEDLLIGPPAIHRTRRIGYIFDSKGNPVAGAIIETRGDGEGRDEDVETNGNGRFEIRGSDFAELTIRVEGHKPLKIDLAAASKKKDKRRSELIKHDGLSITIDYNWPQQKL